MLPHCLSPNLQWDSGICVLCQTSGFLKARTGCAHALLLGYMLGLIASCHVLFARTLGLTASVTVPCFPAGHRPYPGPIISVFIPWSLPGMPGSGVSHYALPAGYWVLSPPPALPEWPDLGHCIRLGKLCPVQGFTAKMRAVNKRGLTCNLCSAH